MENFWKYWGGNMVLTKERVAVNFPFALEWWLTQACNSQCEYCCDNKPEYVVNDYRKVLCEIIELAPKHIFLMGGEPTLVKQLPEIVEELKKELNPHIGISTNLKELGTVLRILPFIDDLIVSLDTADMLISQKYRKVDPEVIIIPYIHNR